MEWASAAYTAAALVCAAAATVLALVHIYRLPPPPPPANLPAIHHLHDLRGLGNSPRPALPFLFISSPAPNLLLLS